MTVDDEEWDGFDDDEDLNEDECDDDPKDFRNWELSCLQCGSGSITGDAKGFWCASCGLQCSPRFIGQ